MSTFGVMIGFLAGLHAALCILTLTQWEGEQ